MFMRGRNEVEPTLASNGAGKSSFWKALCWCIYGKTPEGLKGPDIKPWVDSGTPEVELLVRIDDASYSIKRRAVSNGLKINDEAVGPDEAEKLIGLSFEVFTNTILLAQGQPLFFDRSPKDKMQLFTEVLRLERWEARSKGASDKVRELEQLHSEIQGELTGHKSSLTQLQNIYEATKTNSEVWETERRDRAFELGKKIKGYEDRLAIVQEHLDKAELDYDSAETELKALREAQPALRATYDKASAAQVQAKTLLDTKRLNLRKLESELQQIGESDECPTCGQPLKGVNREKHRKELKKLISGLAEEVEQGIPEEVENAFLDAADAVSNNEKHIKEFAAKSESALRALNFNKPSAAEIVAHISGLKNSRNDQTTERNPYIDQLHDLRRKQAQTEVLIKECEEDLNKALQKIEHNKFWVKGFKDVQLYVIAEVLQELELVTAAMLTEVGLIDWKVLYGIEKETKSGTITKGLNVTIQSPRNSQAVRWESWSGGEAQRLRIVGALALSQVLLNYAGVQTDLEALDEPTRGLSAQGVADLVAFLKDRSRALQRGIWLVDHMAREGGAFDGVVTVVKTPKGSVLEGA